MVQVAVSSTIAEFERAKELNIVVKDSVGNWEIMTTEDLDTESVIKEVTGSKDVATMTAAELLTAIR